jgi:hypothetical protein
LAVRTYVRGYARYTAANRTLIREKGSVECVGDEEENDRRIGELLKDKRGGFDPSRRYDGRLAIYKALESAILSALIEPIG